MREEEEEGEEARNVQKCLFSSFSLRPKNPFPSPPPPPLRTNLTDSPFPPPPPFQMGDRLQTPKRKTQSQARLCWLAAMREASFPFSSSS